MGPWFVLFVSAIYVGSLFVIAWWGDKKTREGRSSADRSAAIVYVLTLAIYNTSWSFYGSVGRATINGLEFASIYVGPILVLLFGQRILTRVIEIAKAQNVTSIADFIAARYGKSQLLGAFVTLAAILGVLPYIALQLKAVGTSFDVLTQSPMDGPRGFLQDSAFGVAATMALFSIVFGVRHIHASEHHRGLMLAVAFESLVKLAAFFAVAIFVLFGISDGPGYLIEGLTNSADKLSLFGFDPLRPVWISNVVLSFIAFLCLPQAFHVTVVENHSLQHVKTARWLYPLYLAIFSVLVLPIAAAGLLKLGGSVDPDLFVIALPISQGSTALSLVAFLGGLSAATGMVIVTSVALSTMLCNDVLMPLVFRSRILNALRNVPVSSVLLTVRRIAVVIILLLAYLMHRMVDRAYPLSLIGLLSFVAVAQFGPAFLGGLFWPRAKKAGAAAGIAAGLCVWAYTLLLPSATPLWPELSSVVQQGLFGISWLRPHQLLGISELDPISHAALWSLGANCFFFVALSYLSSETPVERNQAFLFAKGSIRGGGVRMPRSMLVRIDDLQALAMRFVGPERGSAAFEHYLATRSLTDGGTLKRDGLVDLDAIRFAENLLAGAIGAASARVVTAAYLEGHLLSRSAAMAMLDEASEALRFNRQVLQGALESVPQGICVFDEELNISAWNGRFMELLDLPNDLICVGLPVSRLISFNVERGEYGQDDLHALLINRDLKYQDWPYLYERTRPDGTVLEIVYDRITGGGFVSTYTDVTERHHSAAKLRLANEELEHRVLERTEDLFRAKAEADRANHSKSQFLAAASHDLLQPLNAARLFLSALEERIRAAGTIAAEEHSLVGSAIAALRSTERLLDTLLDMSAYDSGTIRAQLLDFPVKELLAELSVEAAALCARKGLAYRVVVCEAAARSDPHLLRRVLQNLLSNAIRYTQKGGVLVGCRRRGQSLWVEVWDTGPGIAVENRKRIFREFLRLDKTAQTEKGAGLGLAIVKRICRLLNHQINVRSRPGHGSCFSVELPLVAHPVSPMEIEPALPQPTCSDHLRVLCLDNDPDVLRALSALLQTWGHTVWEARESESAIAIARERRPDVAIVDYHLESQATGLEFVDELRRSGLETRLLVTTGDRSQATRAAVRSLGCELLLKPLKPASLRRFLASARLHLEREETFK